MDRFQELITRHRLTKSQIAVRKVDGDPSTTGADETSSGSSRTSSLRSPASWPWPASYQHVTCKRQREGCKDKTRDAEHYIWGYKTTGVTWYKHREDEKRETRKLHSRVIVNLYFNSAVNRTMQRRTMRMDEHVARWEGRDTEQNVDLEG